VTVKVKYADFPQITCSHSNAGPIATRSALEQVSLGLLRPLFPPLRGVGLPEVTLSNLEAELRSRPAHLALGLG
jgi:DNA polymerase-4